MRDLIMGPGIAHSILVFAVIIATGLWLGRFKIKGVSIGSTWILFVAIISSHFGVRVDTTIMNFMKDFGLILFVFSIGLQVGPGFFHSFKKGGFMMNLLAVCMVLLAVGVTVAMHFITGEDLRTMTGVMSGAVTNTPGLGAAQQTMGDIMRSEGVLASEVTSATSGLASAYAVAYPLGVLLVIALIIVFKSLFKVDLGNEKAELDKEEDTGSQARRMHCEVENPAIFGEKLSVVIKDVGEDLVVSRMLRGDEISVPGPDTVLHQGDKLLIVTSQEDVDHIRILFGKEVPMHIADWQKMDTKTVSRRVIVTKPSLTGVKLKDLNIRAHYGVNVTRITRTGIDLVARPNLFIQMGDNLQIVGPESGVNAVSDLVGNTMTGLDKPNLIPIFFGIALGVIFGSLPLKFPGIPQPIKLGLAGGPLIIAILLGYFGPKWKITIYTTKSANMMLREIGIAFFMAAVGLGAGQNFVSSILGGGYWWILYGALITFIPVLTIGLIARYACKLNFYQICGLISGGTTDPAVLAFTQGAYGTDYPSVNYATVYPLSMFMRVLVAQLLVLLAMA
ncbi:MAG: putative transporter [Bacteroidales bacterium]|nr:putative transporter [Bacteroidales bacterium]